MASPKIASSVRNPRATVLSYFSALEELPDIESDALRAQLVRLTVHKAGSEIVGTGERLQAPVLITSGWACRAATLADGRRQILDFYLPGELLAYSARKNAVAVAPYVCLTRVECASADALLTNAQSPDPRWPVLAKICRDLEQQSEIRMLNQILRNGRQTAFERVAHLLFELYERLKLAGLVEADSFALPLTQEVMAEAVGLSTVHMNRTMQQLRGEGLIQTVDGRLTVLDRLGLIEAANLRVHPQMIATPAEPIHQGHYCLV